MELKGWCIYDLAIKKPWRYIFQYPLAIIFLIDFCLRWKSIESELRGDMATNVSAGSAKFLTPLGGLLKLLGKVE